MKNTIINVITLFIGFISFVFLTSFGLVLTTMLLIVGFVAKPFLVKNLKQKLSQVQVQKSTNSATGTVYEGKCERVSE
ncbi:hypothetical protein [Moritella sp. Urea-trap-13]|uniref:hypothetical protein n=1 Tax=Moritella sp. Urea-trap-13 TaxID=2058327 RepID=UPI000C332BED|nr:hypothetical protein [Moritella sp. Urea-trap-13]PKH06217.1 hypothetical protein CXF93_09825 [Moritella sp. Urea-trap-13]